ncbi:hypothetical protein ABVV53_06695 [Novosphingobium sp. RD2P27]|uniref:Uncharacterized protein n=1 Tax=Novosphingobium kalidii TaxID=3230299 RepID=A0ABV2CZV5_9SPHN
MLFIIKIGGNHDELWSALRGLRQPVFTKRAIQHSFGADTVKVSKRSRAAARAGTNSLAQGKRAASRVVSQKPVMRAEAA